MIGLTRQAVRPVRAKAAGQSPAVTAPRVRHAHTQSVSRTAVAHTGRPGSPSRASMPWRDWLDTYSSRPTRLVSHSASVQ